MALTGGEIRLDRSHDGRVANLTIDHGKYNVITWETRQVMAEHFAEIDRDETVHAVVIRAEGQHFSSGGDIAGFMEVDPIDFTDLGHNVTAPARSTKPVVCAIQGYCFGVGLELALSTDIRIAVPGSRFAFPEMNLGMIPGSGGTQRLVRLIGMSKAKYYILTGERITGEQAYDWGLVSVLADDEADMESRVGTVVDKLLSNSPLAMRTAKEVLDRGADGPLYTGIELERKAYAMLRSSNDFAEGVAAFLEKRRPEFRGR